MVENALKVPADKVNEEQLKELKNYCSNQVKKLNTKGKALAKSLNNSFSVTDILDKGDQVITSIYLSNITSTPKFMLFDIKFPANVYREKFDTILTKDRNKEILNRVERLKEDNKI